MVNKLSDEHECPLDIHMFKFIDTHLHVYHTLGLTPNMVTTLAFLFGLFAAYQIIQKNFVVAAMLWIFSYYFDCVDGKLARQYNMVTKFGDYYDHVCDILKYIAVCYALFRINRYTIRKHQWPFIIIIGILTFLSGVHMGYQESVYNKKEESSVLNILQQLVAFDQHPHQTIQYTRHFGCGTWFFGVALLIIFWHK